MSDSLTRRLASLSLLGLASLVQPLAGQNIPASANQRIADDDGFWKTASLREDAELNVDALRQHQTLCERTGADACLVIHRGKIVQEWYSKTYSVPMYA